jgi:hypothetical protein
LDTKYLSSAVLSQVSDSTTNRAVEVAHSLGHKDVLEAKLEGSEDHDRGQAHECAESEVLGAMLGHCRGTNKEDSFFLSNLTPHQTT